MKPWLVYTVARLLLFVVPLLVLLLLQIEGWQAAIIAAVISLCVSYIFMGRLRAGVVEAARKRADGTDDAAGARIRSSDEAAEDY